MGVFVIKSFVGGLSDYEDRGIPGAFKFASNCDIRKKTDSISCGQALVDEGTMVDSISASVSPSSSLSPSSSPSPSISSSISPSASISPSIHTSPSSSQSPSASMSPSGSLSPSASLSPSSSVSPSPSPSAGLLTVFSDLIRHFVKASDGNLYGFGDTGKIYKRIYPDRQWYQVADLRAEIRGAEEKPSANNKTYLVFATKTDLHIKPLPGLSNWNDIDAVNGYPKTDLSDYPWHTMKQVDGDVHIVNGPQLAFIGYDDSYTNDGLDIIPGNIGKALMERNGNVIIGTYRAADPDKGVNGAMNIDAQTYIAQIGDEGKLFLSNLDTSVPEKVFPGGGKVNPGGVTNEVDRVNFFEWDGVSLDWTDEQSLGNMVLLGVYGADTGKGGIYTYGRKQRNQPVTLNLEYQFDADEIGAVVNVNGETLFSYRNGSGFGVKCVDSTTKATAIYEGLDLKPPDKKPEEITTWKQTELLMKALPSGCRVAFYYRLAKNGDFLQAKCADGNDDYATAGGTKATFNVQNAGDIMEARVVLTPSGNETAEIYKIRNYFA